MLGLVSKVCNSVYNFVIGIEPVSGASHVEGIGDVLKNVKKDEETGPGNRGGLSSDEAIKQNPSSEENDLLNSQTFHGTVTGLYSGRGLVDDHIYFSQDAVIGNAKLKIGAKVTVDATRTNAQGGWVAKKVSLFTEWNLESEDTEEMNEINGIITYFSVVSGLINDKYSFTKDVCIGTYHPMVNDFVTCVIRETGGQEDVVSVKPLREKVFVGIVTHLINRYGFVDNDIFFPLGACRGYCPRKGDYVLVNGIESKQRKSQWRAYKIEKCSEDLKYVL